MRSLLGLSAVIALCVSVSYATPYANYSNLEYWAGNVNASNKATLVIDFGNGSHYAFGYGWEGEATGWDMLSAVCAAGGLEETHTGEMDVGFGIMVKSISYAGLTIDNDDTSEPGDTWLTYWESNDGNHWDTPWVGASANPISNGVWNGWTATPAGTWPGEAPIPEPASACLLVAGAMAMLKRRRT